MRREAVSVDLAQIDALLAGGAEAEPNLIALLQKVQEVYGYLPRQVLEYISEKDQVPLARLTGIVTFYAQFRLDPPGKYQILVCNGTACHVNNSERIAEAIAQTVGAKEGKASSDGLFCWQRVACLGCCSLSPAMMINGEAYGKLTVKKVTQIIEGLRAKELEGSEA